MILKGDFGLKYQLSNIYFMPQISSIQLSLNFTKFLKGLDFKALQKKKKVLTAAPRSRRSCYQRVPCGSSHTPTAEEQQVACSKDSSTDSSK